jgi:hypothetical protein
MSHPHAGMQFKTGIRLQIYYNYETETNCSYKIIGSEFEDIPSPLGPEFQLLHDYFIECDEKFLQKNIQCSHDVLLSEANRQRYDRQQQIKEEQIRAKQIIEDQISAKKDIEAKLYDKDSEVSVPDSGPFCVDRVIPDIAAGGLRELSEVDTEKNAEENQKMIAEEENATIADTAQVLSEETNSSPFTSGGTTSLDRPSTITSSPSSGGTSLISPQDSSTLSVETSPPLPPSSLAPTPPLINSTSTTGEQTSAASSADNPYLLCFLSCMPLLPPRTGIGVQVASPPPTASLGATGVYAFVSPASSKNVADNPDNPDLGFDTSGTTPDNPRKPAPDIWAYVASRG